MTIVGNLVENAFEAMDKTSEVRQVELFLRADQQGMTITVDDTGCGMLPEQIQQLLKGPYTSKGAGHGYGMRLIQEIVRKHDGFLQIDSEPGTGTSITINIKGTSDGRTTNDKDCNC